jgi:hypothetical protein
VVGALVGRRLVITSMMTEAQGAGRFTFDGLDAVAAVHHATPRCRIFVTGEHLSDDVAGEALHLGASEILLRPFSAGELRTRFGFGDAADDRGSVLHIPTMDDLVAADDLRPMFQRIIRAQCRSPWRRPPRCARTLAVGNHARINVDEDLPARRQTARAIEELRAAGVQFALDDVGMSYSHLDLIAQIRPAYLKIAHEFGTDFEKDPVRGKIIRNIQSPARDFRVRSDSRRCGVRGDLTRRRSAVGLIASHFVGTRRRFEGAQRRPPLTANAFRSNPAMSVPITCRRIFAT